MSKHTPGPWTDQSPDGSSWGIYDKAGNVVAQAQQILHYRADPRQMERTANARLIAAAPDLLLALDEMLTDIGRANSMPSAVKARAAIAKATGEAK